MTPFTSCLQKAILFGMQSVHSNVYLLTKYTLINYVIQNDFYLDLAMDFSACVFMRYADMPIFETDTLCCITTAYDIILQAKFKQGVQGLRLKDKI